jgi:hypothetical protein
MKIKFCTSVHHRTIQINHQPDATIFQFIILTFVYSSTCFGRFPVHHQELNDCSGSLWFYLCIVVTVVLCSWSGVNARFIYTKNYCYYSGTFLGITPVSSVSNGLYFLTLPLVYVMRVIYTSKEMSKKFGMRLIH